jgi:PAS domain S-box-containing protein
VPGTPVETRHENVLIRLQELRIAEEELVEQNRELATIRLELERNHQRYLELFELAPDVYLVTDLAGLIREANLTASVLFEVPSKFLIGKPLASFIPIDERRDFRRRLLDMPHRLATTGFSWNLGILRREHGRFDGSARVSVVRDGAGAPVALRWLIRDVTHEKRTELERAELIKRLMRAEEEARQRISRELHDGVGQHMAALAIGLTALRELQDNGKVHDLASQLQSLTRELAKDLHRIAAELRPVALDDLGLASALRNHLGAWSARHDIATELQGSVLDGARLPMDVETALYRIVQEALTNVAKHAGAQRVDIVIERHAENVRMAIEDDGHGFDDATASKSPDGRRPLGLIGMRERAELVGGTFEVESRPGAGTTIFVRIPLIEPVNVEREDSWESRAGP